MALELHTKFDANIRVSLAKLTQQIESAAKVRVENWQSATVCYGSQDVELAELFEVRFTDRNRRRTDHQVHWFGRTELLDDLGTGLHAGKWFVHGDVGNRLGLQMTGGEIYVSGCAGHWLAADNRGGQILVNGNVGDYAAAALPGKLIGGNGGEVVVNGSAGDWAGLRMRRGLLAIAGDLGSACAWQMNAGTILCGGQVEDAMGCGMRRGTLIGNLHSADGNTIVPAGFQYGVRSQQPTWSLIRERLLYLGYQGWLPEFDQVFQLAHGEKRYSSRGEIWLVEKTH